jgi:inorganic pyrophosphatase
LKGSVEAYLGREVTVTVDRPAGSAHPEHPNIIYPINYGFIAGEPAPDGEELDAYLLGVDAPVSSFRGRVIAVVLRRDDAEDKLVVAPDGFRYSAESIAAAVWFQERWFDSEVVTWRG